MEVHLSIDSLDDFYGVLLSCTVVGEQMTLRLHKGYYPNLEDRMPICELTFQCSEIASAQKKLEKMINEYVDGIDIDEVGLLLTYEDEYHSKELVISSSNHTVNWYEYSREDYLKHYQFMESDRDEQFNKFRETRDKFREVEKFVIELQNRAQTKLQSAKTESTKESLQKQLSLLERVRNKLDDV